MALNPPLSASGQPLGILGEFNMLMRRGVRATITTRDPSVGVLKASGQLELTTVRAVFLPSPRTPRFAAFDIPLQGISGERFVQPIFGANRLEMDVAMVPGRGLASQGPIHVVLAFNEGGCNRLLRLFFRLLERARALAGAARVDAPPPPMALPQAIAAEMEAFVDPNDPSVIYCVQAPLLEQPAYAPSVPTAPAAGVGAQAYAPQPGMAYAPQPGMQAYAPQPPAYVVPVSEPPPPYHASATYALPPSGYSAVPTRERQG